MEGREAAAAVPGEVCQQAGCLRQHRDKVVEGDGDGAMSGVPDNPSSRGLEQHWNGCGGNTRIFSECLPTFETTGTLCRTEQPSNRARQSAVI